MSTSQFEKLTIKLDLGLIKLEGSWCPSEKEKLAAWDLYVELVTRISVVELKPNEGILREALNSFYSLFNTTRKVLRKHGPSAVSGETNERISVGLIAIAMLNGAIRPLLSKWHPILLDYEERKPSNLTSVEHENQWKKNTELCKAINQTRLILIKYTRVLAKIAEVPFIAIDSLQPPIIVQKSTELGADFNIDIRV